MTTLRQPMYDGLFSTAGGGTGSPPAPEALSRALLSAPWKKRKICIVGTSLVQHNQAGISTGTRLSNWSKGWMNWGLRLAGVDLVFDNWADLTNSRYFQGANQGVSGQISSEIVDRLPTILRTQADAYVVDNGTNECASSNYADIIRYSQNLYENMLNAGAQVGVLPILDRGLAVWPGTGDSSNARLTMARVNDWRRQYCRDTRGAFYLDWNVPMIDSAVLYGPPRTGYLDSDDIHFSPIGAYAVGNFIKPWLQTIAPPKAPLIDNGANLFDVTYNPQGIVHPNPFYIGTAGTTGTGASGTVSTGMRVERSSGSGATVVASVAARADGRGNDCILTITPGGGATEVITTRTNPANTTLPAGLAGTWVRGACAIDVAAYTGYNYVTLVMEFYDGASALIASGRDMQPYPEASSYLPQPNAAWAFDMSTPPVLIPASAASYRFRVDVGLNGGTVGSPVVKMGALGFRPIDDPRVLWNFA